MNLAANKTKAIISITLILLSSIALSASLSVEAQVTGVETHGGSPQMAAWATSAPAGVTPSITIASTAFMAISPNPIGITQTLLVNLWIEPPTHYARYRSGYTVTITKPDGTKDTVGPLNSYQGDTTAWFQYVPEQVGTYQFKFDAAGNYFPAGWYYNGVVYPSQAAIIASGQNPNFASFSGPANLQDAYYQGSSTSEQSLTVQASPVLPWPTIPLPTGYWTRPIPVDYRDWWVIGGQFPFVGQGGGSGWPASTNTFASNYKFTPYVQAPNTAHIAWLRQGALSGIAGGQYGYRTIGSGEGAFSGTPSIIFQGRAYQAINKPFATMVNGTTVTETTSVWQCYDIRTGQIYWEQTGIAQVPTVVTYNIAVASVPGAEQTGLGTGSWSLMYVGSRLVKYDPWSGAVTLNISLPVSSGTYYNEPYVLSVQTINATAGLYRLINWTTTGTDTNFTNRIMSNISYPFSSIGTADYESMIAVNVGSIIPAGAGTAQGQFVMGASLTSGALLWNVTTNDIFFSTSTGVSDHGRYTVRVLGGWWDCWDLSSGKLVWQTPKAGSANGEAYPWGDFGAYTIASYGGLFFDFSYAGIYAIRWSDGSIAWHFVAPEVPFEAPWYPSLSFFSNSPQIADGKLYYANGEHSPTEPLARGWHEWCLNATSGQEIWNYTSGGASGAVADGYLTFGSVYDGYLYTFGKGETATTVTAPDIVVANGTGVVIKGTVSDMSPAQPGTPCVSADSMTTQMEYLHMQLPINGLYHNITMTGVPVVLTALDSSNNPISIGTVTTNPYYGTFSFAWTPPKVDTYTITASFVGDDSYGSSSAATAVSFGQAPTVPIQPQTQTPDYTMLLYGILVAVVIAIIIGLVAIALVLRKRA
jgi:outer membrane protein assembly factor BamB